MAESNIKTMNVKTATAAVSCLKSPINFARYGKLVIARYILDSVASVAAGDLGTVGTIPVGFRPKYTQAMVTTQDCTLKLRLRFDVNGDIVGYNYSSATSIITPARFPNLVYIAAD